MSKSDYEKPVESVIHQYGYEPGEPVCLLYKRDGNDYWVSGYKIFDPEERFSVTNPSKGGYRTIHLNYCYDKVPVSIANPKYFVRPTYFPPDRVRKLSEVDKVYSFDDVYAA